VLDWGLTEVRKAVAGFVTEFGWLPSAIADFAPLRRAVGGIMREFWCHPTYEEASVWGSFPYFDDQTETYWNPLAEPSTISDMFRIARRGRVDKHVHSWNAASNI
jgi:hypothetical protein